jgi:hypothetical protein
MSSSESAQACSPSACQVATIRRSSAPPSAACTQSSPSASPTSLAVSSQSASRSRVFASRRNARLSQRVPSSLSNSDAGNAASACSTTRIAASAESATCSPSASREASTIAPRRRIVLNGATSSASDAIGRPVRSASEIGSSPSGCELVVSAKPRWARSQTRPSRSS